MKRKVAELPPVNESDFKNRMLKHEEQRKALSGETKVKMHIIGRGVGSFLKVGGQDQKLF